VTPGDAPRPPEGTTHWETCWRSHLDCAVERVESAEGREAALRERLDAHHCHDHCFCFDAEAIFARATPDTEANS
jgi:hypothetical protein